MSETPEPDEIQPGSPPDPPDQPGDPAGIMPGGEQSEAAEAPQPSWPEPAAPDADAFAPPGSTAADPDRDYAFADQGSAFAGQPWAGSPPADLRSVTGPAPVLMSFGPPASQQRVTVAFRAILAIPHLIVLVALVAAAEVVAFIGWWAALFTGQIPSWAHEFITGVLRWQSRVYGYLFFLTDQYPPFSLDDADYPVRLFTKQTRLNRLAVFFRVILMIPVWIVSEIMTIGLILVSIVAWLITLVTGRMPARLHEAFAAIIRWDARFFGYLLLVTPEYPGGLWGDTAARPAEAVAAAEPAEPAEPAEDEELEGEEPAEAVTAAEPSEPVKTGSDPWRLVLPEGAKTLVTVALVVGFLGFAANIAYSSTRLYRAGNNAEQQANAYHTVTTGYNHLRVVVSSFEAKVEACDENLTCVTKLDGQVAHAFQVFGSRLRGADVPSSDSGEASALTVANTGVVDGFSMLSGAKSASEYSSLASSVDLEGYLDNWQRDYNQLSKDLKPAS
jgi:Domain of unknown function (DUF4389)